MSRSMGKENKLEELFELAKVISKSMVKNKKTVSEKIDVLFNPKDKQEIIDRLENAEEAKKRLNLLNKIDEVEDWKKIQTSIHKPEYNRIRYIKLLGGIAAIFVIGIGLLFFKKGNHVENTPLAFNVDSENIILKLANGNVKIINENGEGKVYDEKGKVVGNQEGEHLNYVKNQQVKKLIYNELSVPNGKTFKVLLSDGTKVQLNAGTVLKYPINFIKGKNREVHLVGEAFFEVAKDKAHPFIVHADNLNVRVLGTSFNVNSYPEDKKIKTVLVEGSIALYGNGEKYEKNKSITLSPGKKATYHREKHSIKIKKVNPAKYLGWLNGEMSFYHLNFATIINKLQRHYNVKIKCTNKELKKQIFTATFREENISQVLESFKLNYPFEYQIQGNNINIYEP